MLWHYILILLVVGLITLMLSFHKSIDNIGRVFFLLISGSTWYVIGISLLKIEFKWAGATSVVSYTYIPSTESGFTYLFLAMGVLMWIIGIVRAWALTYQPVVDGVREYTGEREHMYHRLYD